MRQNHTAWRKNFIYRLSTGEIVAVYTDETETYLARDILLKSKEQLDLILNSFNGFIYTVSKDYKIEFMNNPLIDHIGHDTVGENCFQLIHGLNETCPWCDGEKVLSGDTINFEHQSPKNNRWYY